MVVESLLARAEDFVKDADNATALADRVNSSRDVDELLSITNEFIDGMTVKPDSVRARYALLIELEPGELRTALTETSPMRRKLLPALTAALSRLGVADAESRANEVFELGDALIWQRTVIDESMDIQGILRCYLYGLLLLSEERPQAG